MSRLAIYESKVVSVVLGVLELGDGRSDPFFKIAPTGDAYVVEGPGADGQVTMCGTVRNHAVVQGCVVREWRAVGNPHCRPEGIQRGGRDAARCERRVRVDPDSNQPVSDHDHARGVLWRDAT